MRKQYAEKFHEHPIIYLFLFFLVLFVAVSIVCIINNENRIMSLEEELLSLQFDYYQEQIECEDVNIYIEGGEEFKIEGIIIKAQEDFTLASICRRNR